jgi:hypothetical protein
MIVLITPTGGRPIQFNLCAKFMKRQSYTGKVMWIIIDDCEPRTTDEVKDDFRNNWTIIKEYPVPVWQPGQNTQARNISVGINIILSLKENIEAIFIIEDDDYYKSIYLEHMMTFLKGFWLAGETRTIYYNVFLQKYAINGNIHHVSLFQIAFTTEAIPALETCYAERFIDFAFSQKVSNKNLFTDGNLAIGIKGLPGRYGIGMGHQMSSNWRWPTDINMNYLRSLIGDDIELYRSYYGNVPGPYIHHENQMYNPFFNKRK